LPWKSNPFFVFHNTIQKLGEHIFGGGTNEYS